MEKLSRFFSFLTKNPSNWNGFNFSTYFCPKNRQIEWDEYKQTFTISFVGFSMGIYISKYSKLKYIFNPLYLMHVDIIL